jgi:two-component system cell cycle sensor histidine kinase/response regulator CckA
MQECNSKQEGACALLEVPPILRMAMDACPHGLTLCSGGEVLYSNAAWKRLESGQSTSSELLGHIPDTRYTTYDLRVNESPIQIRVLQDITERKQLESQLHEAQRLEALGRWVGAIVHDFRNVLTAVMLYSDLLEQRVEAGSPAAKYNDEVREAARRGTDLIGQLLSFARQRAPEVTVLSVNSLLNGIRDVLRRMSGEDIELKFDLCDSPCRVLVDATQMQQVVFNLVVNARQAMPEGGHMVISTRENEPDGSHAVSDDGEGWVEMVVSDEGVGMDEATLSRAFEPFFTTKPKGKGTGLGLTTVQSIITQYGGSVSIESKPALGTTVTIILPRADEGKSDVKSDMRTKDLPVGAETVLVVEDEASVRSSISELLRQSGYHVVEAGGGLEAIQVAEMFEGPIDLLLADMVLPGLSGREIARRIKLSRPGLRVLFISGYESAQDGQDSDIFSKPFTREKLARKVREALDSNRSSLCQSGPTSV